MEKKMVRPYMTAEARDAMNHVHKKLNEISIKHYNRSEAIISILGGWDEVGSEIKSQIEVIERERKELKEERKKNQEWKVYCAVLACTTIASLVALAIQAA